jgi:transcriptional regulator with XRE-family HTH domain
MPRTTTPARFQDEIVAGRIRRARERAGLTKKQLAEKASVETWSYLKKESGRLSFSLAEISRIADALDAPMPWPFLGWDAAGIVQTLTRGAKAE